MRRGSTLLKSSKVKELRLNNLEDIDSVGELNVEEASDDEDTRFGHL